EAVLPVAPPVTVLEYDTLVMAAGKLSVTVAPGTALGPLFRTTMTYAVFWPGAAVGGLSVTGTARAAGGVRVSVSVAELFPELGSNTVPGAVTVAMAATVPVAVGLIVAVTV